jgi:pyruvate kinase
MKKTKIVCTIGPASESPDVIEQLLNSGMNAARLNFSHGTHEEHAKRIKLLKTASRKKGCPLALILDTKGPEIRIKTFKSGKVELKTGNRFVLTARDVTGDNTVVSVTYPKLPKQVSPGDTILLDDGFIRLKVLSVEDLDVVCNVEDGGLLKDRKGVNIPGVRSDLPAVTAQDEADICFGIRMGVDYVAASFVRKASDILDVRRVLENNGGGDIQVISKIESREGVDNFTDILKVSDGIMLARGDLGVEIPPEEVPLVQKNLIERCHRAGKPVITATQMLESMIYNPRPTRAEVNDVANAIFDGSDAVMLSGETAAGSYPVESVKTMAKIAQAAENSYVYKEKLGGKRVGPTKTVTDAVGYATVSTAEDLGAAAIITATSSGYTARMVSKYRPSSLILAATPSDKVMRKLCLYWGIYPVKVKPTKTTDEMIDASIQASLESGLVKSGDLVVLTAGIPVGVSGTTNLLKVHVIGDILVKGMGIGNTTVSGPAWVAKTAKEVDDMPEGAVLIVSATDMQYVPALKRACAVVSEEGGLTSHAAIVALELGIPAVVGADGATEKLKSGMTVTINAIRGLIYKGEANSR